jgi:AcrR family transcriptional regulator
MIPHMQNAISEPSDEPSVIARVAQRAVARREAGYADEVRRLLDAGLEVMHRRGTTSSPRVADIVQAAGLSNEAFYRHFASKEDLVAAIVDSGAERLVSYLRHQMGKERDPRAQVRVWIEGVVAQAADPAVAAPTRAVLWNGNQISDRARANGVSIRESLAHLLEEPLATVGSADPERDARVACHAVMGRMEEFLWRQVPPRAEDVSHLVEFCLAAVGQPRP